VSNLPNLRIADADDHEQLMEDLLGPGFDLDVVETRLQERQERDLARGHPRHRHRGLPRP
jgi:hypothetical protein